MIKKTILIIFSFLLLASCSGKTKEDLFSEGMKLLTAKNPAAAIVLFKNALEKDQNFFDARFQLAKAYMEAGKFEQAGQEYQKLLRMNPAKIEMQLELARSYLYSNKADEALKEVDSYLKVQPRSAEALEIQGYAYSAKGDLAAGENCLTEALRVDPGSSSAKLGLASIYVQGAKTNEAKALLQEVIDKDPGNIKAYYMLAGLQASLHQRDDALLIYKKIAEIAPSESEPLYRSGMLYLDGKEYDKAGQAAAELISRFPKSPQGHLLKGIISCMRNDVGNAILEIQQSLSIKPTLGGYYYLGIAYYQKGDYELALSQFQKVIDYAPQNIQARLYAALIHLKQKRFDNAFELLKKLVQEAPDNALAHNLLGNAYIQQGMNEEGMKELSTAIKLDPKLADAHLKKGMVSLSAGNLKEGETELRAAVRIAPEDLNTRFLLSSYYINQKNYQKAVATLKEGLNGSKSDAPLYNSIAIIVAKQKKFGEALSYFQKAKEADPDYFAPYFNVANYYTVKGETDKAFYEYNSVLQRNPRNVQALVSIAMLMEMRGQNSEAASYYAKAKESGDAAAYFAHAAYYTRKNDTQNAVSVLDSLLKLKPGLPEACELKGKILLGAHQYKEALAAFEDLEKARPDSGMPYIVNTCVAMKDYNYALKRIENKLAVNPEKMALRAEMARIYMLMGDENKAVESAGKIISWKQSGFGYMVLASVYEGLNKTNNAIDALKKGIQADSRDVAIRMKLADIYAKRKEYSSSINMYESALKINPRIAQAYFGLGTVYEKMGKSRDAVKKYRQTLENSENYVPAMNNLAFLLLQGAGSKEEALELAIKSYRAAPESPEIMDTLGYALVLNHRVPEGLKILQKAAGAMQDNPSVQYHLAVAYKESGSIAQAKEALSRALKSGAFPESKSARNLLDRLNGAKKKG